MSDAKQRDLSRHPLSFMIGWGLPIMIFFSMNFVRGLIPNTTIILILAGAFAWMGAGCLLNARRCGRRHCYFAGPVFLAGAVGVLLVGFQVVSFGADGLVYVAWATWILVGLTFVPEWIWGRYVVERPVTPAEAARDDWVRRFWPFMLAWGIPIILVVSVNFVDDLLPAAPVILMMAGAYAWMGTGCVLNALRCGRLHCYVSGPALLIGAALIFLIGYDIVPLGAMQVMHVSFATLGAVAASFVLEWIWGAYAPQRR